MFPVEKPGKISGIKYKVLNQGKISVIWEAVGTKKMKWWARDG